MVGRYRMWIDSDILCGGGVRLVRGVSYVVRTAFRRRQATPDGQTDTVQTNRTLSVVNPSAVHWHGTALKLTARQMRRQPIRCRWLGTVLEFTARQIQSKRTEFCPSSSCPLSAGLARMVGHFFTDIGDLAK